MTSDPLTVKALQPWLFAAAVLTTLMGRSTRGDEGMWLFESPPRQQLAEKYQFTLEDAWLDHVRSACVKLVGPRGHAGSGAVVSPNGLLVTNHHVVENWLVTLAQSTGQDYVRQAFYAHTPDEEKPCPGLSAYLLDSIEDVTEKVQAVVQTGMSDDEAEKARDRRIARLVAEATTAGLTGEVIKLDRGARYHLYRYRVFKDLRLVFAPEKQIAFFGGDLHNFEYPRYSFEVCFLRIYVDGHPWQTEHFLPWNRSGVEEGDLVFVAGCPGETDRHVTIDDLSYLRDTENPFMIDQLKRFELGLATWGLHSEEQVALLAAVRNSIKARGATLRGLLDNQLFSQRAATDRALRDRIAETPCLADTLVAWDQVRQATSTQAAELPRYAILEGHRGFVWGFNSQLFKIARVLVRLADEQCKPDAERLPEYQEARVDELRAIVLNEKPISAEYEMQMLADSLTVLAGMLAESSQRDLVKEILAGKQPVQRAVELVEQTTLRNLDSRRKLFEALPQAVHQSADPMLRLARLVDAEARSARSVMASQVDAVKVKAYRTIAMARTSLITGPSYPDASSTLRLSFGVVKGYEENGKPVAYRTTLEDLFRTAQEHAGTPSFELPVSWTNTTERLNLQMPLNFVHTADTIAGNSGSPVLNRRGEVVGVYFDGNSMSRVWAFAYTDQIARAISVDALMVVEALRTVYGAQRLTEELVGGSR